MPQAGIEPESQGVGGANANHCATLVLQTLLFQYQICLLPLLLTHLFLILVVLQLYRMLRIPTGRRQTSRLYLLSVVSLPQGSLTNKYTSALDVLTQKIYATNLYLEPCQTLQLSQQMVIHLFSRGKIGRIIWREVQDNDRREKQTN